MLRFIRDPATPRKWYLHSALDDINLRPDHRWICGREINILIKFLRKECGCIVNKELRSYAASASTIFRDGNLYIKFRTNYEEATFLLKYSNGVYIEDVYNS